MLQNFIKLLIFFFLFIIIIAGCQKPLSQTPTPSAVPISTPKEDVKPLIFAAIPMDNRLKMLEGWTMLADYITEQTGIPVEVDIKKSYNEIIDAMDNNEVDFCYCGPLVYVEAHEKAGAIPLVKPTANGKPFYNSVIIVRKDSGINSISELKGKKFAFTDRNSTSGYLFPRAMLAEEGIDDVSNFFSEVIFTNGHDSSLESVYQSYIDGAGIFDYAFVREPEADPKVAELKIIKTSDPIPMGPVVLSKDFDEKVAKELLKVFLQIGKDEETKKLAEKIKVDGYIEAEDKDYDSIRKALQLVTDFEEAGN